MNIGFIGYGTVASNFARQMKEKNTIIAYDSYWNVEPYQDKIVKNAHNDGVHLVESIKELAVVCNIVFSTAIPSAASHIAKEIAPYLHKDLVFIDLNSSSPMTKKKNYEYLRARSSMHAMQYVDGCIMGSVDSRGANIPIILCGEKAEYISHFMNEHGMSVDYIQGTPGDASAVKMIRSVFMKGIEVLFVEMLDGAYNYNVEETVLKSIRDTFNTYSFDSLVDMLVTSHSIHAKRRFGEMTEVINTLENKDVDATMSHATKNKLLWSSQFELDKHFNDANPPSHRFVLEALNKKKREK